MSEQAIKVPLKVGSRVSILTDVRMDADGGWTSDIEYEAWVEQYMPQTNKLVMSDGTNYAEFVDMLEDAESVQIIYPA